MRLVFIRKIKLYLAMTGLHKEFSSPRRRNKRGIIATGSADNKCLVILRRTIYKSHQQQKSRKFFSRPLQVWEHLPFGSLQITFARIVSNVFVKGWHEKCLLKKCVWVENYRHLHLSLRYGFQILISFHPSILASRKLSVLKKPKYLRLTRSLWSLILQRLAVFWLVISKICSQSKNPSRWGQLCAPFPPYLRWSSLVSFWDFLLI